MRAIANVPYNYGSTNTANALRTTREIMFTPQHGDRHDVPNFAIILTDGVSTVNSMHTIPEAELTREAGIIVYAVGIGLTDNTEINDVADKPLDEHRYLVDDFPDLQQLDERVFNSICRRKSQVVLL